LFLGVAHTSSEVKRMPLRSSHHHGRSLEDLPTAMGPPSYFLEPARMEGGGVGPD
jgi:hypothetical protein